MRFLIACVLIIAIHPTHNFSQPSVSGPQGNPTYELWLARSQTITEDLIKDATDLNATDGALVWAKLAQRWWRVNPEKARLGIQKAVDVVKTVPNRENPTEKRRRVGAARSLLQIVTPLDQESSKQLISILAEAADNKLDAENDANADGLVAAARLLVPKEPQRALELGMLALRVGRPAQIGSLILALRPRDGKGADTLLLQALESARQSLDGGQLNSLSYATFPETMGSGANEARPPDDLRVSLLKLDVAYLQANPVNAENKNSICAGISAFISPVLAHFDRLLPQQAAFVKQSVLQCDSSSPLVRQRMDEALNAQPLNTVEALLKAADDAQNTKIATVYRYRAATLAKEKKDYDLALKILESIDKEGREFMGGSWEAYRWEWAALAALEHYKNGDLYGMRLVINSVPGDLQPFARIAFVGQLAEKRNKETDPTLEFLNEARTGLRRSGVSDAEKCTWYFGLLRLTVKYQPADATDVLKETVSSLNRAVKTNEQDKGQDDRGSFLQSISSNLPASLMEMDEYAVKEAVSSIAGPEIRIQVRLDLLGACLARLRNLKEPPLKPGQSTSKGE